MLEAAQAVGAGDRDALSALFDAEFGGIYGFLVARCGSTAVAEDVAAETFVEAARAVTAGRIAEVTRSWLYMVARRRLIDHWRADERHRRRLERLRLQRSTRPLGDLLEDEMVLAALQSLPTRQRAALTLRYLDECSVAEVADTLDVSYRAAESLLSRAKVNFRSAYGADDA
jgi:RNA polymerase sigma-70 factor (ECF subfamily)